MEANIISMVYQGFVEIKLILKDKIYPIYRHNAGCDALSKTFAKVMSGNYDGDCNVPHFLDVRTKEGNSILNTRIRLSGANYDYKLLDGSMQWVAEMSGVIQYTALSSPGDIQRDEEYSLVLVSGPENANGAIQYNDMATLELKGEELQKITAGTQAIVTWQMVLKSIE